MKAQAEERKQVADSGKLGRELLGLLAIFCGLLTALSLATFDSRDPWLNHVVSGVTRVYNKAGLFGAYTSGFFFDYLGFASWVIPAFLCLAGARRILGAKEWPWWRWAGFALLSLCLCLAGAAGDLGDVEIFARGTLAPGAGNVSTHGGGIIGYMLYRAMVGWLSSTGTFLLWLFSLLLAMQMLTGLSWLSLLASGSRSLWHSLTGKAQSMMDERAVRGQSCLSLGGSSSPGLSGAGVSEALAGSARAGQPPLEVTAYPLSSHAASEPAPLSGPLPTVVPSFSLDLQAPPQAGGLLQIAPDISFSGEKPALFTPVDPYVHPLLPRPGAASWEPARNEDREAGHLPSFFEPESLKKNSSFRRADEEEDLPPWVRDFEQDRVGVQALQAHAPQAESLSPYGHGKAATEGAAEETRMEPGEPDPLLSLQTSLAIQALRAAGSADSYHPIHRVTGDTARHPGAELFDSPDQDLAVGEAQEGGIDREPAQALSVSLPSVFPDFDGEAEDEFPASEKGQEAAEPPAKPRAELQDNPARALYDGPTPVFEAPPLQIAPEPGLKASLARHLVRPPYAPLPSLDLLRTAPASGAGTPRELLEAKGRSLMNCLNDFSIQGELVGITPGPVVTMFEIRPAPGVRVSRIANLSDDLALALKAVAVRIQAPVPGTDTVGIEIPNEVRETVCLKELLSSQIFQQSKSLLTLALGKDIAGLPAVADLASMPHLLVAGATGAGKSVGINSIILSFLYKARPEEVKLLLVDPKRVEMAIYADLPHLVHPVVTEMQMAKNALEWAVAEMEERYNAIAKAGVRNIADYNAKLASWGETPPIGMEDLAFIPYLVIVIDELADLMLVAAKEVETSIVRLAQLARAAGIHLILATQRPSVDVVTGLIKANFPCRISFQVTSKHDSRTILDAVGAEHLLGKGDMLFKPGGGKFKRMHGAFVSDQNVNAVVGYWKSRQRPDYQVDFSDWAPEGAGNVFSGNGGGADIAGDPLYNEAVEFVRQQGKASISLIQRKFRIGFNKAARFVEQMELDGIIGPADGSKPRMVIR